MSSEIALNQETNSVNNPLQPIVLTSPEKPSESASRLKPRGFLSTFVILLAGWLLGNLILLSILGIGTLTLASSTGLVRVPFLTGYFFGTGKTEVTLIDTYSLHNGEEKIKKIQSLPEGTSIKSLVFYEDEINALLANKVQTNSDFPIIWQNLALTDNSFVFKGRIGETNAPVIIKGQVSTHGLTGEIQITEAKYGKIAIPSFVATSIVENQLSAIGLSLSGNQIPARAIEISNGLLKLLDVTKPQ